MPGRHRERVPGERARLVHGPGGRDELHDLAPAAVGADRQPAADHLPERRQIRRDPVERLRAARVHAEAGHDLVEDEQRAVRGGELAQPLEEARGREHEPHVPDDRLEDHGRDLVVALRRALLDRVEVVERRGERVGDRARRHARRVGQAERRDARSRLHEEEVGVPVVAADELDDLRRAP